MDRHWSRFQIAAIEIEEGDDAHCSPFALHQCRISRWLSPPPLDDEDWMLVSRSSHGFMLYFYSRQKPEHGIEFIGDILIVKLTYSDTVIDMTSEDQAWIRQNLEYML